MAWIYAGGFWRIYASSAVRLWNFCVEWYFRHCGFCGMLRGIAVLLVIVDLIKTRLESMELQNGVPMSSLREAESLVAIHKK